MSPSLYILRKVNLADRLFCKDFFTTFGKCAPHPSLLLHENLGSSAEEGYFTSKRVVAQLSEALVTCMPLPNSAPRMYDSSGEISAAFLEKTWSQLNCIVLQPTHKVDFAQSVEHLVSNLRKVYTCAPVRLFPDNPMSALVQMVQTIETEEDSQRQVQLFPEEKAVLQLASRLAPAVILSPQAIAETA